MSSPWASGSIFGPTPLLALALALAITLGLVIASGAIRYIDNNRVAVVERLWSLSGSIKGA
jgi:hypothetical protein